MSKRARARELPNSSLFSDARHYSRQLWLASLGAYAKVGLQGLDYLRELTKSGAAIEQQSNAAIGQRVEAVGQRLTPVRQRFARIKQRTENRWAAAGRVLNDRVAQGLNLCGVPSRQDVAELSAKLDVLSAMLATAEKTK